MWSILVFGFSCLVVKYVLERRGNEIPRSANLVILVIFVASLSIGMANLWFG